MTTVAGRVGRVAVVGAVLGLMGLIGCRSGGSDDVLDDEKAAMSRLEADRVAVDGAVSDVLGPLTEALQAASGSGRAGYRQCGMEPQPSGAQYESRPQLVQPGVTPSDGVEAITALLAEDGWQVEPSDSEEFVSATRDNLTVSIQVGPAAADVRVESACVDTSADLAREYARRPSKPVEPGE